MLQILFAHLLLARKAAALAASLLVLGALNVFATDSSQPTASTELTLEQLVDIEVTSVSKKETRLEQSPAAISVITQEDIRRSGLTSIPELLRLVPGLDVASINANQWAISSRGFNNQYANKLLVLIDGRAVYTPSFGGVFWNAQDAVLQDLARIEVIRGPGATLWGANAVNGVINIATKSAKETQGFLMNTIAGTADQPSTSFRYGGELAPNLYYRVYLKYFNREGFVDSTGKDTPDDWNATRGGVRLDWEPSTSDQFTLQGDYYHDNAGIHIDQPNLTPPTFFRSEDLISHNNGGNVLGRWTHGFSDHSQITLQAYYDRIKQDDGLETLYQDTVDFDLQHHFSLGKSNDIVWGAGYRFVSEELSPTFFASFSPAKRDVHLFNVFAQDDITIVPERLHLTLGSKFEHNNVTGFEVQPSARVLWTPAANQTIWAAASHSVRTPSFLERDSRVNLTPIQPSPFRPIILPAIFGNPNAVEEKLDSYELGYRIEPTKRLSFDITGFYNVYDDLQILVTGPGRLELNPSPPHIVLPLDFRNNSSGETYGAELSARWQVTDYFRLMGSYTWLRAHLLSNPAEHDSPEQQFQLHSYLDLPHDIEVNGAVYFVDRINSAANFVRVPIESYVRVDLGVTWHPTKSLEIGIWGQNLFDNHHPEAYSYRTRLRTEVPRGVMGTITLHF